jgi:uncharacterized protein (DUF983 family)
MSEVGSDDGGKALDLPTAIWRGVAGRCPRCGQGKLFSRLLTVAPGCTACGLDYGFADPGDGPAVFVMLFAGFLIVGLALFLEVAYEPPYWVYFVVFPPLTILVCLGLLRPLKGVLLTLQYRNKAEQGRIENLTTDG